jgi:predicted transport protein
MKLYSVKKEIIEPMEAKPFLLEKDIQKLVEKNTEALFQLEFVTTELAVGNYRIDTLCFDTENNSFVIIEYKKGKSYSVIDQGYTYLQLLLNNKSDFLLERSLQLNKVLTKEDVDWTQTRIIFVSPSFNSYQKDSVNFKNLPFELYEIKRFKGDIIVLNKHQISSKESIDSISTKTSNSIISSVNKEVKVYDEELHISKMSEQFNERWIELKERLLNLEDVELSSKKMYISLRIKNKAIAYLNFRKNSIAIEIPRGNLNTDGTKSKNYFTLEDPKRISKERSWEWKSGTQGNVYLINFDQKADLDYTMFLIKQKYNAIINSH